MLKPLISEINGIINAIDQNISTAAPLSLNSGNWSFPGITKADLVSRAMALRELIEEAKEPAPESQAIITNLGERLTFLRTNTVPQFLSQGGAAVSAYLMTLDAVEKVLTPIFTDTKSQALKNSQAVKKTTTQVRSIETRLRELEPRTVTLESMVARIEKAHDAADQLPTDLESLAESQKKVADLLAKAQGDKAGIGNILADAEGVSKQMVLHAAEAREILARCESVYSSATSVGLAAAFTERSKALDLSMWGWVAGLVVALIVGGVAGSAQLHNLAFELTKADSNSVGVGISLVLSILSVGGPVWFAWLSTKQIGQRFRLSEDYAFKASISRAYEGYRREASRIDPDLERQLLGSALSRLDEQPLRLVENDSFGSPWHEFLSSDVVKDAVKSVPGFVDKVTSMATAAVQKKSLPVTPIVVANDAAAPPEQAEAKA
ncbi:hypothetical protein [Pseudomonas sp. NMI760_13]|uniref:hypothetical protein n=1 Tax=Pseudomonas sp. NMI760_13 TaxID=2903147 RepID=UPI001E57F8A7|nr:hypothetical protein [Pseudomonas sp. NMI760_13]MCE0917972.1 hypothetical protein [Pseudomonas sp. NMI760_13]